MDALVAPDELPDKRARIAREKHTLLERHAFERVGTTTSLASGSSPAPPADGSERASSFAVRPPVMHFGGFEPGKTHTQSFVVTNTGAESRRLVVIDPGTEHFRVARGGGGARNATTKAPRGGKLAPGASERIDVAFTPTDGVRYYYDCCRVHAEGAPGLLLPMHAYPVMNRVFFPRVLDFGLCEVGQTAVRSVAMTCAAPIAFEYELKDVTPAKTRSRGSQTRAFRVPIDSIDSCFSVTPAFGIVPAEGTATIAVAFSPKAAATATLELEVNVAQFGFEPFVCRVRGTGFPASAAASKSAALNPPRVRGKEEGPTRAPREGHQTGQKKPTPPPPAKGTRSEDGSFRADAAVAAFELRAAGYAKADAEAIVKRGLGPRGRKLSARALARAPSPGGDAGDAASDGGDGGSDASEDAIDGVFVPRKLRGASDFARVLGQKHGKLRAKDIENAVSARDARARQAATLRESLAIAAGAVAKMKASAAASAFRKLLAREAAPRTKRAEDEETSSARDGDGRLEPSTDDAERAGTTETSGVDALRGVFEAARFRSKSEDETMAALDDPLVEPEVKAHLFEREFERVRRFEKAKEWTECVAVGEARRTGSEAAAAAERRRAREAAARYAEASAAMARLARGEPSAFGARFDARDSAPEDEDADDEKKENPTFDPSSADDWPKRREALDRFAQAARRVVARRRAEGVLSVARRLLRAGDAGAPAAALFVARDAAETMARAATDARARAVERTLDPARRAFARARAEEVREARLGAARLDASERARGGENKGFFFDASSRTPDADALEKNEREPPRVEWRRAPTFPAVRASAFARRHALGDAEMARAAIKPWEEVTPLPLRTRAAWRARGYRVESDAANGEGASPALEGDGAFSARDARLPAPRAGAQEEESSGVGVPARLVSSPGSRDESTARATTAKEGGEGDGDGEKALAAATAVAATVAPDAKRPWDRALGPARFPPRSASFATPGPASRDRAVFGDAILPATYGHDDSLVSEPAGMNAVFASGGDGDAGAPSFLAFSGFADSERSLTPREEAFESSAVDAWTTEWMSGPDPRDLAEGEGEGETPAAAPAPTLASVAEEVAKALGAGGEGAGEAATTTKTRLETAVVPGGVAARALMEREMDAEVASSREARMRRVEARAAEIDAAVADPRTRWRLEG